MADIVDRCQALVDEHFGSGDPSPERMRGLLPNPVIGREGELLKAAGSILPDSIVDRIHDLSYEFMGYPENLAQLGLEFYRTYLEGDGQSGANRGA